jgi:hypothetical protein
MRANDMIAVYNATTKQLVENEIGGHNFDVQAHAVYMLEDYAFVDAEELADYTHDDLIEAGWEQV